MDRIPTRIAFVGAGNIAGPYSESVARHADRLELVGVYDVDTAKAAAFAAERSCAAFASLAELAASGVELVVNLTSAPYHYATTRELIGLGLNVFSEKPLALTTAEARELVELARASDAVLACAPSLWLGRAYQGLARRVLDGEIGRIGLVTAEVHQGRIESWHPAPRSFYQVGPTVDAGVYPLSYLTAVLGPIRQVSATSRALLPTRTDAAGDEFAIVADDAWLVAAVFESGALLRLTTSFYVGGETVPRQVALHGDAGSLRVEDWIFPDATVSAAGVGEAFTAEPGGDPLELDWSLGVLDLAAAIREGRPPRTSVEHAAHIVEVLEAIAESARTGTAVGVDSGFPSPFAERAAEVAS